MCPLRIILIFLSATLAGFFVLRNIKSQSDNNINPDVDSVSADDDSTSNCVEKSSYKVYGGVVKGFWTCVDMASGRYLWRNLVSVNKKLD